MGFWICGLRTKFTRGNKKIAKHNSEIITRNERLDQAPINPTCSVSESSIDLGPWGGDRGRWWDDGSYNVVREIRIHAGQCIDSISVVYDLNGEPISAEKHGGNGGSLREINLQYPDEYLVGVSGHYAPCPPATTAVIRSLTFRTNRRTFGPYGQEQGTAFTLPIMSGHIASFFGRSGLFLDAIGFHIACD